MTVSPAAAPSASSAAAKISGAGLKRPTWALVTAPSTRSPRAKATITSSRSRLVLETARRRGRAARRRCEARPHVVVEREVLGSDPRPSTMAAAQRSTRSRAGLAVALAHGRHDRLGDDSRGRRRRGVAALVAARLDRGVGAPLGLVPAVRVEAQAKAGAGRRGSPRR